MTLQRDLAWNTLDLVYRSAISRQLARYALGITYDRVPPEVLHQVKRSVLDTLGCAVGAYEAPGRLVCEGAINELGGADQATVFCSGMRTSVLNATIVNSFLVRFLDFNDSGGGGHNSDCMASIFAVGEHGKASGKEVMMSIIVSYEIGGRFREACGGGLEGLEDKGWMGEVRGGISMPPAIGRLMGLNEEQIANAIGITASHSLPLGILDTHHEENTMAKNLRLGAVCYNAILNCTLAKHGFTGPLRVIEGEYGFSEVIYDKEMDLAKLTDFSGWRMRRVRHKYLPANYVTQGHAALTLALVQEHDIKPEDVARVKITVGSRELLHAADFPAKKYPRNAESADHSAHFTNAIVIKERALGPDQYAPEKFTDPVILDLIEKIEVVADPTWKPSTYASTSEITLKDGRTFSRHKAVPKGHFDDPLTDAEIEHKVRSMMAKHLPETQIRNIIDTVWNMEKVDDIGTLIKLMVFPKQR
jgi:2-methylcitrate dehydratase